MDLTTRYMGLHLKNPLVASASPLTGRLDGIRGLEDAGAAALVLPSLFQEEIEADAAHYDRLTSVHEESWPEACSNFPALTDYQYGPQDYLELVRLGSKAVDIPVIASLNGTTNEGWISYAKLIEEAGAKGLELNIYFLPVDLATTGRDAERRYLDVLSAVRAAVSIPVAVKLSPYFSSIGNMALALQDAGADALVLFNRFYQPDLDLARLQVLTDLKLSEPNEIRLPLLWLAVLAGRVTASLAASTGVSTADEVV
jgi:dihydroorotate dehydrogenase (fumarate)